MAQPSSIYSGMIKNILMAGLGGAVGAMLRYAVTLLCGALQCSSNIGTAVVNAIGSFAMGLLVSIVGQSPLLVFLTVGLCGGFTTFSTFSLQSLTLVQQGKWGPAALYILGTVSICLLFAFIGVAVGNRLK